MAILKSLFKFSLKFLLVIVIVLVVVCVGLLIWYAVTIQSAEEYLPEKFLFYVKIDSLKEIYDNVLDLKAADVIFSQPEFKSVHRALLEFKSNDFSRDPLLKALLSMRASLVVHPDRSLSMILEPGLLSLATRNFSLLSGFLKVENLNLKTIQKGEATIYGLSFSADSGDQFFFSVVNNLVLASDKLANVEAMYKSRSSGKNLKANQSLAQVQGKLEQKGILDLYVSTPTLIDVIFKDFTDVRGILSLLTFNETSLLSFNLSNDELKIGVYASFTPKNEALASFLAYQSQTLQSLKYLPASATVYSTLNVKSFKDLFNLRLLLQKQEFENTLAQINDAAQTVLGMSVDDLLFNWVGEELGAFLTAGSGQPVIFLRVRDRQRLETVLKRLDENALLEKDSSLVFNNLRLSKIDFPPFVRGIVNLFVENLTMPYFYATDDFLFLCMEPEVLAGAVNDFRAEKVLLRNDNFRLTTEGYPKNANLFLYYDLTRSQPPFFPADSLPGRLFRLYESGLISLYFDEKEFKAHVNARGIGGRKTVPFAGFPKTLEKGTSGDVACPNLYGSAVGELVYIDNENNLVIQDFLSTARATAPLEPQSVIVTTDARADSAVFTFAPSGTLGKYEKQAQPVSPFPVVTMFKNSFPPVDMGSDLLLYSRNDRCFFLYPKAGGTEKKIEFGIDNPVLAPPAVMDGQIAFYPKSFEGTVFVITPDGKLMDGWSQNGDGISLAGPVFMKNPGSPPRVVFLTQAGLLKLWSIEGRLMPGFPQQLSGTYFTAPCPAAVRGGAPKRIAVLNEGGTVTLLDQAGAILKEKTLPEAAGRNSGLAVYDIDRDGEEEVFIYGAGNLVIGLDSGLELLPGFPVKGGRKPAFTDVNLDGKKEMVTAGFDNQLYVYELNK